MDYVRSMGRATLDLLSLQSRIVRQDLSLLLSLSHLIQILPNLTKIKRRRMRRATFNPGLIDFDFKLTTVFIHTIHDPATTFIFRKPTRPGVNLDQLQYYTLPKYVLSNFDSSAKNASSLTQFKTLPRS
jgi:hypothetical protein